MPLLSLKCQPEASRNIIVRKMYPYVQGASSTCEAANTLSGASQHMRDVYTLEIQSTSFIPEVVFELLTLRELTLSCVSADSVAR
jgi:hypothetical protein